MPKRKPEKVVCVFFDQVNDFDPGAWVVADGDTMVEGAGFGQDRKAAIKFATERAKTRGARLEILEKE